MCSGNCLIECSDEIDRDRTAVLGEDRQSPVIAAKTRTHREFNAHVFHRPAKENPDLTELERSGQGKLTEMVRGLSFRPSCPMGAINEANWRLALR